MILFVHGGDHFVTCVVDCLLVYYMRFCIHIIYTVGQLYHC